MHSHTLHNWQHRHDFLGADHARNERRTRLVVWLTLLTMVAEIAGGWAFGSMALTADGWHMSTHALALGVAALAYRYARTHASDPRFSFGTAKLGELAAFASALILVMVALAIGIESAARLVDPQPVAFGEALPVAVLGLIVNLVSAVLLHGGHHDGHRVGHSHAHGGDHRHAHGSHDANLRAAYVHVLSDALTSVLAILALVAGRFYGVTWLDPAMGLAGTVVIVAWAWSLLRSSGAVLLDTVPDRSLADAVRARLERDGDRIADLHLWRLGPGHSGLIVSLVADAPLPPAAYKARLADLHGLSHVTVEVNPCPDHAPLRRAA